MSRVICWHFSLLYTPFSDVSGTGVTGTHPTLRPDHIEPSSMEMASASAVEASVMAEPEPVQARAVHEGAAAAQALLLDIAEDEEDRCKPTRPHLLSDLHAFCPDLLFSGQNMLLYHNKAQHNEIMEFLGRGRSTAKSTRKSGKGLPRMQQKSGPQNCLLWFLVDRSSMSS